MKWSIMENINLLELHKMWNIFSIGPYTVRSNEPFMCFNVILCYPHNTVFYLFHLHVFKVIWWNNLTELRQK
jgi:hypothetical protein